MKRFKVALIVVTVLLAAAPAIPQEKADSSAAVKSTLLQLFEFSNKQALQTSAARILLIGDALDWKMTTFGKLAAAPDKIVLLDDQTAVGRIQTYAQDNRVVDLYFYLKLQDSWKVSAVRALALTGILEGAYRYLKSKPSLTAEEKDELGNYELLLASDESLRQWFAKNTAGMNKLYEMSRGLKTGYLYEQNDPKYAEIKAQLKSLHLGGVEVDTDGTVEFIIGGVTDNTVGFLYSPTNQPPKISPDSYIWIEEIAPKWFIFRTT
jgi:hypothetical protein